MFFLLGHQEIILCLVSSEISLKYMIVYILKQFPRASLIPRKMVVSKQNWFVEYSQVCVTANIIYECRLHTEGARQCSHGVRHRVIKQRGLGNAKSPYFCVMRDVFGFLNRMWLLLPKGRSNPFEDQGHKAVRRERQLQPWPAMLWLGKQVHKSLNPKANIPTKITWNTQKSASRIASGTGHVPSHTWESEPRDESWLYMFHPGGRWFSLHPWCQRAPLRGLCRNADLDYLTWTRKVALEGWSLPYQIV